MARRKATMSNAAEAVEHLHRDFSQTPKRNFRFQLGPIEKLYVSIMRKKIGVPLVFFDAPLNKADPASTRKLGRKLATSLKAMQRRAGGELKVQVLTQYLGSGWRVRGYATPLRKPDRVARYLFSAGRL